MSSSCRNGNRRDTVVNNRLFPIFQPLPFFLTPQTTERRRNNTAPTYVINISHSNLSNCIIGDGNFQGVTCIQQPQRMGSKDSRHGKLQSNSHHFIYLKLSVTRLKHIHRYKRICIYFYYNYSLLFLTCTIGARTLRI